jgi:PUA domain protein
MKKWVLSRHDSMEEISRLESSLSVSLSLPRSSQATCVEPADGVVFILLDGGLVFVRTGGVYFPFLGSRQSLSLFPSATVDVGAVKFLLNGADVMRPGVKRFDMWGERGRLVVVKEEEKGRAVAVGSSLVSSSEMESMSKGPCLKNIHHVGDRYWELYKQV